MISSEEQLEKDRQLYSAVCSRNLELIKQCIRDGGNPNFVGNVSKRETSLHVASYNVDLNAMRELIAANGDIFQEEKYGGNSLHKSVSSATNIPSYKKAAMMKLLYETDHRIINTANTNGETPIYWAVYNNDGESILILRALGADLGYRSRSRETALEKAYNEGKTIAIDALNMDYNEVMLRYNQLEYEYASQIITDTLHDITDFHVPNSSTPHTQGIIYNIPQHTESNPDNIPLIEVFGNMLNELMSELKHINNTNNLLGSDSKNTDSDSI